MSVTILKGTAKQRRLLWEAAEVFTEKLDIVYFNSDITVFLVKDLYEKEGIKGDIDFDMDDDSDHMAFDIRLDSSMNMQALIRALAHELVHVKQYLRKEIEDGRYMCVLWKGKRYVRTSSNYWDYPWEIEAYGREIALLELFVQVRAYQKEKWYVDLDYA